ncbi:hypothetical protein GCM10027062_45240 [Nocardioides hungaricus]
MRITHARLRPSWVALVTVAAVTLSACGGSGSDDASAGDGLKSIKVAWSSEASAYIPQSQGPWRYGADFGLAQKESDITQVSSSATAIQLLLSGRAEVVTGSFTAFMQAIGQGNDLQMFCPIQGVLTDEVVGVGDVKDIKQVTDPNVTVALDAPGGLVDDIFNHVFSANGMDIVVGDLSKVIILEDGGLRLAALASGEAQVAMLDPFEIEELKKQRDDVNTLSLVAEDMNAVGFVYAATPEWLSQNQERAAAFCASVLKANQVALGDFETYVKWAEYAMDPAPARETLKVSWDRAKKFNVWPVDGSSLSQETYESDLEIGVRGGQIQGDAAKKAYEEVIDPGVTEAAVGLLNQ